MPQKIIIDTDPGQDDALAMLLAFGSPELEVLGITAVAGVVAAGVVYQARRARLVDASQKEVSSDVTVEEVLYAPASDEKAPASPDKDLTLVR